MSLMYTCQVHYVDILYDGCQNAVAMSPLPGFFCSRRSEPGPTRPQAHGSTLNPDQSGLTRKGTRPKRHQQRDREIDGARCAQAHVEAEAL